MENEKGQCEQLEVRTVLTGTQLFLVKGMSRPKLSWFVCLFASKALNCKALSFYKEKQKKKTLASIGRGSLIWRVNLF